MADKNKTMFSDGESLITETGNYAIGKPASHNSSSGVSSDSLKFSGRTLLKHEVHNLEEFFESKIAKSIPGGVRSGQEYILAREEGLDSESGKPIYVILERQTAFTVPAEGEENKTLEGLEKQDVEAEVKKQISETQANEKFDVSAFTEKIYNMFQKQIDSINQRHEENLSDTRRHHDNELRMKDELIDELRQQGGRPDETLLNANRTLENQVNRLNEKIDELHTEKFEMMEMHADQIDEIKREKFEITDELKSKLADELHRLKEEKQLEILELKEKHRDEVYDLKDQLRNHRDNWERKELELKMQGEVDQQQKTLEGLQSQNQWVDKLLNFVNTPAGGQIATNIIEKFMANNQQTAQAPQMQQAPPQQYEAPPEPRPQTEQEIPAEKITADEYRMICEYLGIKDVSPDEMAQKSEKDVNELTTKDVLVILNDNLDIPSDESMLNHGLIVKSLNMLREKMKEVQQRQEETNE